MSTIEDLKTMRAELVQRRRDEAYMASSHDDERLAKLVHVHAAIAALDEVIAEGKDEIPSVYESGGKASVGSG